MACGSFKWFELFSCIISIYFCYLLYGVLQERLYKTNYSPDDAQFGYSLFLLFVQCLSHTVFSFICILLFETTGWNQKERLYSLFYRYRPKVLIKGYGLIAASYLLAMFFSNYALHYVSYPLQTLGKSSKMIPVMLMGILIRRKKYSFSQYLRVVLLCFGVFLFSYQQNVPKTTFNSQILGILFLLASLFMDGLTGPLQERLVQDKQISTYEIMFYQNLFAVSYVAIVLFLNRGWLEACQFIRFHPQVLNDIVIFCLTSAVGQGVIVYTICNYSALVCATVTTTRKFLSVLVSYVIFGHIPSIYQFCGVFFVFVSISWEILEKYRSQKIN
ncbi:Solute carrier family 35 member B1 [Galdieria sulphuraria]|nr:Solute carrier family 35 member B1 [Galdieria sulphuraria]